MDRGDQGPAEENEAGGGVSLSNESQDSEINESPARQKDLRTQSFIYSPESCDTAIKNLVHHDNYLKQSNHIEYDLFETG